MREKEAFMQKETQMEIIVDYYKVLGNHSLNERFSKEGDRVYAFPIRMFGLFLKVREKMLYKPE